MRKLYILLLIVLPVLGWSQTLTPEAYWHDGNSRDWTDSDKGLGTTFFQYNGVLYCFNYQGNGIRKGGHAYMYNINEANKTSQSDLNSVKMDDFKLGPDSDHDNQLAFGYPGEGSSYDEGAVYGRTFGFVFNGRQWYFQHIRSAEQGDHDPSPWNESYECFAELPTTTSLKCNTHYWTTSPASTVWKMGGFQYDTMMYFIALNNTASPKNWTIQEYYLNSTDNKFHYNNRGISLPISYTYLGDLIRRIDVNGNEYMLATFYDQAGNWVLGKLVAGFDGNNKRTFSWTVLLSNTVNNPFTVAIGVTTMAAGTFKANRTLSDITDKTASDRMVLFGQSTSKSSDGYYHIYYAEYYFQNDQLVRDFTGGIYNPSSHSSQKIGNYFHLYACSQLKPVDYIGLLPGDDGYQQYIWLLYPDSDRHTNGLMFLSDFWRCNGEWVDSNDLNLNEDYPDVENFWSLLGYIDGPPPAPINWQQWSNYYTGFPISATKLEFESDTSGSSEFSSANKHEWSVGKSIDISAGRKKLKGSLSESYQYSRTFENTLAQTQSWTTTYGKSFELKEENQEFGYGIYSVPNVRRYSFSLYPWWDSDPMQYPINGSFQYMFETIGSSVASLTRPLDGFPFYIEHPNDSTMHDWHEYYGRKFVYDQAANQHLGPIVSVRWDNYSPGSYMSAATTISAKTSNSQTTSYSHEVEAGVTTGYPKVCEISEQVSKGYNFELSLETSTEVDYGKRIMASLQPLESTAQGIKLKTTLTIYGYLFTAETGHWWYLDSIDNGQTPFYLAWVVTSVRSGSITPLVPADGSNLGQKSLTFAWQAVDGILTDYVFDISKSPVISDFNTIYEKKTGSNTEVMATGFEPEPGVTYYWRVYAHDEEGNLVYSPTRSFRVGEENSVDPPNGLKAMVVSNPGTLDDLRIVVSPETDGKMVVSLTDMSGSEVAHKELSGKQGFAESVGFAGMNIAPGVYLAVITSGNEKVVKKIILH